MNKKISKKNFTIARTVTTTTVKKYLVDVLAQDADSALAYATDGVEKATSNGYNGDEGCIVTYSGSSRQSVKSAGADLVSVEEEYTIVEN